MAAGTYNFKIEQFSSLTKKFVYRDALGTPIDLTGFTAKMQIRKLTGELILELTTENGRITLGAAEGTVDLHVADDDTDLVFNKAVYDIKLQPSVGDSFRWLEGTVTFSRGVTK